MVKKKKAAGKSAKKSKKALKKKAVKKTAPKKKAGKPVKPAAKAAPKPKEKVLGMIEHYFGHISVAALKLVAPLKVGDHIHVKGHTTDFVQRIDSIQVDHQSVPAAKKGDDIGVKVKGKVREHDLVYLAADEKKVTAPAPQPLTARPAQLAAPPQQKFLKF